MATYYYIGNGLSNISQIDTLTVGGTIEAGDEFKVTFTGEDSSTVTLTVVASSTSIATTCTEIAAAINASTNPLVEPLTAAAGATTVTVTAGTAGVPFYCTVTTTESGGGAADAQTFTRAATTANRGPSDYNVAINWSGLIVPVASDVVVVDGRQTASILYGLNQSAVALASFTRYQTAYAVGQASIPLQIRAAVVKLNVKPTDGSSPTPGFTGIDVGSAAGSTVEVFGSATSGSSGREPVCVKGTHASHVLRAYGGIVGLGTQNPADTAQFPTVLSAGKGTSLFIGSGVTAPTTLTMREGANIELRTGAATIDASGAGLLKVEGSGAITTANLDCKTILNGTGTITTIEAEGNSAIDTTQTENARTVTNYTQYGLATLKTNLNTTYTNGIKLRRGARGSRVDTPDNLTVSLAA